MYYTCGQCAFAPSAASPSSMQRHYSSGGRCATNCIWLRCVATNATAAVAARIPDRCPSNRAATHRTLPRWRWGPCDSRAESLNAGPPLRAHKHNLAEPSATGFEPERGPQIYWPLKTFTGWHKTGEEGRLAVEEGPSPLLANSSVRRPCKRQTPRCCY